MSFRKAFFAYPESSFLSPDRIPDQARHDEITLVRQLFLSTNRTLLLRQETINRQITLAGIVVKA